MQNTIISILLVRVTDIGLLWVIIWAMQVGTDDIGSESEGYLRYVRFYST